MHVHVYVSTHSYMPTHTYSHAHKYTHTNSLSLFLSFYPSVGHTKTKHTHTLIFSQIPIFSFSLTNSHTHPLSLNLSLAHFDFFSYIEFVSLQNQTLDTLRSFAHYCINSQFQIPILTLLYINTEISTLKVRTPHRIHLPITVNVPIFKFPYSHYCVYR